jgi:diphthamide synthase subunit DPH2
VSILGPQYYFVGAGSQGRKNFKKNLTLLVYYYYFEKVDNVLYFAAIMVVRLRVGSRRAVKGGCFGAVTRITGGRRRLDVSK